MVHRYFSHALSIFTASSFLEFNPDIPLILQDKAELIDGKVDWKGRTATKDKHGGFRTSLLVLGNNFAACIKPIRKSIKIIVFYILDLNRFLFYVTGTLLSRTWQPWLWVLIW